jgi:rhodanese-related sulfurtransferase
MIKASSVHDELDGNIIIIDIRDEETFAEGHIKNAANVEFSNLPEYFSNEITPSEFDKIVVICYSGQVSCYATLLLRLMDYNNVYSMKWGMSGWNKDFANDIWLDNISSDYQDQLEVSINEKALPGDFPKLNTGKDSGKGIFDERIKSMFEEGTGSIFIRVDSIFSKPQNYYTINYDRRDKYEDGHLPGAIRYKPNGTLGIVDEMQTLPTDKEIVTYCQTGQNSGFVTAYLRLFGYDAKSLLYGNNAFMHDKMVADKITLAWLPFTLDEIEEYDYVK